jgi:tryptophan-rich sensory protein
MAPLTSPIMLLVFVVVCLAAGRLGAALTEPALETWYRGLAINVAWSFSFFGQRNPFLGLVCWAALFVAVVLTTIAFSRVSRPAGWLFLPYLLWLGYAGALNFAIWRLNS